MSPAVLRPTFILFFIVPLSAPHPRLNYRLGHMSQFPLVSHLRQVDNASPGAKLFSEQLEREEEVEQLEREEEVIHI